MRQLNKMIREERGAKREYDSLKKHLNSKDKKVIDRIERQEAEHHRKLIKLKSHY